jgi:hypothetical protein
VIIELEVPCCQRCFDWMVPVLLVEHPVQAAVWCCPNGCCSLMHGFAHPEDVPEYADQRAIARLARQILEGAR